MRNRLVKSIAVVATVLALLCSFLPAAMAAPASAKDITKLCKWAASSSSRSFKYAIDGNLKTSWTSTPDSSRYIDFTVASPVYSIGGIYYRWNVPPSSWELFIAEGGGSFTSILKGGEQGYLTQFVYIPSEYAGCKSFRLVMNTAVSACASLSEISVYSTGPAPYYAPQWQEFPSDGRVDLLTIVAHPDDDALYMSVPAVTCAAEGKATAMVWMTYGPPSTSLRRFEAQECGWALGNKYYPVMGNFKDTKTVTKEKMAKVWGLDNTVGFIVEQIRRYRPSVIVTHDINGEYRHGGHRLTEYATQLAFQYAADPDKYPESAQKYGTWKAGKLYVHLYKADALNAMSLTTPLGAFGGRTVLQTISDAYKRHKSQLPGRRLPTSGAYDMRKFGLFATNVGADITHSDMFENISLDVMLALNPWYNFVSVDRSKLAEALNKARFLKEEDFKPESWSAANLPAVIDTATAALNNNNETQARINEQTAALEAAMVKLVSFTGIAITMPPSKLTYTIGDMLDVTGMIVTASYGDNTQGIIPITAADIKGFDSSAPAAGQTVIVTYYGRTAAFSVDIVAKKLVSIEITSPALKTNYFVGEPLDLTGLKVTGTYNNGSIEILPVTAANVTGFDSSVPASGLLLTITIDGKTAVYTVDIAPPSD